MIGNYVYLIKRRKEINENLPIFKIGKTDKPEKRMKDYNNPLVFYILSVVDMNSTETEIINKFNKLFNRRLDIGLEYYESENTEDIKSAFLGIVLNNQNTPFGAGKVIYRNKNESSYYVKWKLEFSEKIKSWYGNRDADKERCEEIYQTYFLKKEYVPLTITLAYDQNNNWVCLDGNHRRLMIDYVLKIHPSTEIYVNVVLFNTNDISEIRKIFLNINKSMSVPELFLNEKEESEEKKYTIEEVKTFITKFKKENKEFISQAISPHRPNINDTQLFNFFTKNLDELKITLKEFEIKLQNENTKIRAKAITDSLTDETKYKKCEKHNLFLFFNSVDYIIRF